MVDVVPPVRTEPIFDEFGNFTIRYYEFFEGTVAAIEETTGTADTAESTSSQTNRQNALVFRLEQRVSELEDNDISSVLNSKILKLGQKVDQLIDELLAELRLQRPDIELENTKIDLLRENIKQLKLLNMVTEEAFNTGIDEEDV